MTWLPVLPIVIPMATGVLAFLAGGSPALQRLVALIGAAALLIVSVVLTAEVMTNGIVAAQMGMWQAPFGITLVVDHLSAVMVLITAITGLAVLIYAFADISEGHVHFGFHPLLQLLLAGVCGAFTTGDVFNLYVWFEVMLISSFGLLVLGGTREQLDGGIKYVALNLISTVLFLGAIGILYGMTGTLNMADLHLRVQEVENGGLLTVVAMMFMIAFGIKSAVFPLFFWLPASYHTPPVAISAVFSGLLTKVGVYAMIRMFTLIFTEDVAFTHTVLLWVAGLTMITGVLGAAAQNEMRRILSFHIVSQIGYMIMGLALYTPLGLLGAVFYLVHHIIVKANLFLVAGVANRLAGSFELKKIGGLYKSSPLLAVLFLIPAFSLAGFPPLSGFWAKLILVQAAIEIQSWAIVAVALVVGLLTIYSMTKIWAEAFWKPHPKGFDPDMSGVAGSAAGVPTISRRDIAILIAPIAVLATMTVIIGLYAAPFVDFAAASAAELLDPAPYIAAVLGDAPLGSAQ
ncbi:Na+/H+ antiporter subunit D [Fodinicurvata sp. EGI_FJ10296]|uniref:Na+/H+ antiporter subunit D n=1 Tax=Fodinicurvata sp. EGI_FJ10296 TaxID=3231908 RepID=UPI003456E3A1